MLTFYNFYGMLLDEGACYVLSALSGSGKGIQEKPGTYYIWTAKNWENNSPE